jgi:lysylphosphatidylglycerol synthetase-like protein (DUF2156 family)
MWLKPSLKNRGSREYQCDKESDTLFPSKQLEQIGGISAGKDLHMANRPLTVSIALIFTLINSLVWLTFGVTIAANVHPALPIPPLLKGVMAFLSLAAGGILLVVFIFLGKRSRVAYYIALGLFNASTLLTIFDQFGLADLVILCINIVPIILLIKDRAWYLQEKPRAVGNN